MERIHSGGDPPPVGDDYARRKRNCRTDERKACEEVHHKRET